MEKETLEGALDAARQSDGHKGKSWWYKTLDRAVQEALEAQEGIARLRALCAEPGPWTSADVQGALDGEV